MKKPIKRKTPVAPQPSAIGRAKESWLPLHVARLRFFPAYAASAKTFHREIQRMVRQQGNVEFSITELEPYVLRIATGGVGLLIDANAGEFEIEHDVNDDEWEWVFEFGNVRARPAQFPTSLREGNINPNFLESAKLVHQIARRLISALDIAFASAVASGAAEIFGRWRDVKAEFEVVHPDQWDRLRYATNGEISSASDVSTMNSDGSRGDLTIYSIHVSPHRKQTDASNLARIECVQWLKKTMQDSPHVKITRDTLEIEARKHWNEAELPQRTFLRCYAEAKNEIKPVGYLKPGPAPKLVRSTG